MANQSRPTVREMVREAVDALGGDTTNVAVRDWILSQYPGTKANTVGCHIIMCTVNHPSRVHYGQNLPRSATDERYDFLFRPQRGRLVWYDPEQHGQWRIEKREDGSMGVARIGDEVDAVREPNDDEGEGPLATGGFAVEAQLRDYLAGHLNAVEEGLQLYVDDYGNTGVEYTTPVGRIDVLCEDARGGLVVIELKVGRPPDAVVGQLLRYLGWVKRHLAEGRSARGIIIADSVSDRLRYAVADLPDVSVKEYELSLTLRDVAELA